MITLLLAASLAASPYAIDRARDEGLLGASFATLGLFEALVKPQLHAQPQCTKARTGRCDPHSVLAYDQLSLGTPSEEWARVSDLGDTTAIALSLLSSVAERWTSDASWEDVETDLVVLAQAANVATWTTSVLKLAVRRPRPTNFVRAEQPLGFDHQLSFPSGHTASTSSLAFAYASTFWRRHPASPWRYVVGAGAIILTVVTATGRVRGGWHFPTDVAAGGIIGVTSGLLIPYLYTKN